MRAEDLNAAVKELAGEEYTCKDLRTWNATVLAAVTLAAGTAESGVPLASARASGWSTRRSKQVSEHLGNTPAVARSSYIDPRVLEQFAEGRTVLPALRKLEGSRPTARRRHPGPVGARGGGAAQGLNRPRVSG